MISISKEGYNKYDVFLFLLVASLIGGNMFGALQIPRVLALLFAFPCINCTNKATFIAARLKTWLVAFVAFSFLSSIWSPAGLSQSFEGAIYNLVHALLFYEIIIFSGSAKNPQNSIVLGFFVAFSISAIIAFWELITDNHLSTSKTKLAMTSNTGFNVYTRIFAAATFFNFNMFTVFLCLIFPFIAFGFINKEYKSKTRLLALMATVLSIILVLFNGSRGGLFALVIMIGVLLAKARLGRSSIFYLLAGFAAVTFFLVNYGSSILLTLTMRLQSGISFEEEGRFTIWNNVLKVITDYPIIGCGTDGLVNAMQKHTNGTLVAHNLFLEILSQYGLLFTVVFVVFLVDLYKSAKKSYSPARKVCVFMCLISFPFVAIINSNYITSPSLWAVMACIYVFANFEQIRSTD